MQFTITDQELESIRKLIQGSDPLLRVNAGGLLGHLFDDFLALREEWKTLEADYIEQGQELESARQVIEHIAETKACQAADRWIKDHPKKGAAK